MQVLHKDLNRYFYKGRAAPISVMSLSLDLDSELLQLSTAIVVADLYD